MITPRKGGTVLHQQRPWDEKADFTEAQSSTDCSPKTRVLGPLWTASNRNLRFLWTGNALAKRSKHISFNWDLCLVWPQRTKHTTLKASRWQLPQPPRAPLRQSGSLSGCQKCANSSCVWDNDHSDEGDVSNVIISSSSCIREKVSWVLMGL